MYQRKNGCDLFSKLVSGAVKTGEMGGGVESGVGGGLSVADVIAQLPRITMLFPKSALLILAGWFALLAPTAHAWLWGWPKEWTISQTSKGYVACEGSGNYCPTATGWDKCRVLQEFRGDRDGSWFWNHDFNWGTMRKKNSAWIDLWKADGGKWNLFESNKDGHVHGQCEAIRRGGDCPNGDNAHLSVVALHCWQW